MDKKRSARLGGTEMDKAIFHDKMMDKTRLDMIVFQTNIKYKNVK
jgi:hypothetical protein